MFHFSSSLYFKYVFLEMKHYIVILAHLFRCSTGDKSLNLQKNNFYVYFKTIQFN